MEDNFSMDRQWRGWFQDGSCTLHLLGTLKNLPPIHQTQVQSLAWEDPLEKEMATYSSILAWEIPWREEPSGL